MTMYRVHSRHKTLHIEAGSMKVDPTGHLMFIDNSQTVAAFHAGTWDGALQEDIAVKSAARSQQLANAQDQRQGDERQAGQGNGQGKGQATGTGARADRTDQPGNGQQRREGETASNQVRPAQRQAEPAREA